MKMKRLMLKIIPPHDLKIQPSKGDKLVKPVLMTGLLICLPFPHFTVEGSRADEAAALEAVL